jgi:hypothetical protein
MLKTRRVRQTAARQFEKSISAPPGVDRRCRSLRRSIYATAYGGCAEASATSIQFQITSSGSMYRRPDFYWLVCTGFCHHGFAPPPRLQPLAFLSDSGLQLAGGLRSDGRRSGDQNTDWRPAIGARIGRWSVGSVEQYAMLCPLGCSLDGKNLDVFANAYPPKIECDI